MVNRLLFITHKSNVSNDFLRASNHPDVYVRLVRWTALNFPVFLLTGAVGLIGRTDASANSIRYGNNFYKKWKNYGLNGTIERTCLCALRSRRLRAFSWRNTRSPELSPLKLERRRHRNPSSRIPGAHDPWYMAKVRRYGKNEKDIKH